jgi:hypothetical protein
MEVNYGARETGDNDGFDRNMGICDLDGSPT